jgi:hypothetical protein
MKRPAGVAKTARELGIPCAQAKEVVRARRELHAAAIARAEAEERARLAALAPKRPRRYGERTTPQPTAIPDSGTTPQPPEAA